MADEKKFVGYVCTGCGIGERLDASQLPQLGYGKSPDVVTNFELEKLAKAANGGPIKHMCEVLNEDLGYEEIAAKGKKPREGIKSTGYLG